MLKHSDTSEIDLIFSKDFSRVFPGASVGILVLEDIEVLVESSGLDDSKKSIVLNLQSQFPDFHSLKAHPIIKAYSSYYKLFNKTYHVLGQLKSVIFENRPLPSSIPLVEAVFAAELKTFLLTAVHDLDLIKLPLEIGISTGDEIYTMLRGNQQQLKPGDMKISDREGVLSSILYGPDSRTRISSSTTNILITVYAPNGIPRIQILGHFDEIKKLIRTFAPQFKSPFQEIYPKD